MASMMAQRTIAAIVIALAFTTVTSAIDCPRGQALVKGACKRCPVTTYSVGGANAACKRCPAGTESSDTRDYCVDCGRNYYGRAGRCIYCPKGTYATEKGSTKCTKCTKLTGVGYYPGFGVCGAYAVCKPGMKSFLTGCPGDACWSADKKCCVDRTTLKCVAKPQAKCQKGQGLNSGGYCAPCPAGRYNDGSSDFTCKRCPPGTESDGTRTFCVDCPALKYSRGGSMCKTCPKGTYSDNIAGTGPSACTGCSKKIWVDKNGRTCSDYIVCEPGQVAKIENCPDGHCFFSEKSCCVKTDDPNFKCVLSA